MPIGEVVNKNIHNYPSEHARTENLVRSVNAGQDKVTSPVPGVTTVGGEMKAQGELHKVFIRQGPSHHYSGDGEHYGKQDKL